MMHRPLRTRNVLVVALLLTAATAPACLDFTPITEVPDEDGGATDAKGLGDSSLDDRCLACVGRGGDAGACPSAYTACTAVDKCEDVFSCGLSGNCFAQGANLLACVAPCATKAGITSTNDPAVGPLTALYLCIEAHCKTDCEIP